MELRLYQKEAVQGLYQHFRAHAATDNPIAVLPTGTGKTLVIRQLCHDVVEKRRGRAVVLAHRKELLSQAAGKIDAGNVTTYSASLKKKDLSGDIILAQIQSIWTKAFDLGKIDLAIVDECHLVAPDEDSMFTRFLTDLRTVNPDVRIAGLTATPYRMADGEICSQDGTWRRVAYEYPIGRAVNEGFLTPLVSTTAACGVSHTGLHVRAGEYVTSEVEARIDAIVDEACLDIVAKTGDRKSVLVFCVSRAHARVVAEKIGGTCVLGDMQMSDRDEALRAFNAGEIKYLVNVDVLTTGFDSPRVDAIAMLRATLSRGLFIQIAGRGMRLYPGKANCLFLDYGGNVRHHGPIDAPYDAPRKVWSKDSTDPAEKLAKDWECPECGRLNANGFGQCVACQYVRTRPVSHDVVAAHEAIMSAAGLTPVRKEWATVMDTHYFVHTPRQFGKQRSVRVEYMVNGGERVNEWVCFEHEGFALKKAQEWWAKRSKDPFPGDCAIAVDLLTWGCAAKTLRIKVDRTNEYPRPEAYDLGEIPEPMPTEHADWLADKRAADVFDEEELPF